MATMADDALKKQFEILQQKQQEKLQRRKDLKKKQKEQDEKKPNGITLEKTTSSFGVEDNLLLKTEDPLPKSASYVSEELIDHLNEQIRELKDENGRLFKLLSERDFQIRQLKKKREEDRLALGGSTQLSSDSAASRIVELSKKVRELSAALEAKKTEAKQLFGRCRHLENELGNKTNEFASPRLSSVTTVADSVPTPVSEAEIKQVADKLKAAERRNAEYRNQVQGLRDELKMAHKVITNEVGEGAQVAELLNANSGWRGRAQTILALQKKIVDMKSQSDTLKTSRSSGGAGVDEDLESSFMGSQSKGADMRQRDMIRKLERERKEHQEKAAQELKALEGDFNSMKQKFEASKARNKVLANENKSFKTEMQKLVDKGQHDDELISALIAQQKNMKLMIDELSSVQKQNAESQQERMSAIAARGQQENNVIQQLKAIVAEKESKVKTLEQELTQLKHMKMQESQMNSVNALFERPSTGRTESVCPNTDHPADEQDMAVVSPTPSPPASTPQPQNTQANSRPNTGGSRAASRQNSQNKSRGGSRPASRRVNSRAISAMPIDHQADVNELEVQLQESQSLAQAAQVERDKLMELLTVMQKRLDEANDQTIKYQTEMKTHKQNAVQLEKLIGKMKLETNSKSTSGVSRKKSNMGSSVSLGSAVDMRSLGPESRLEELETALSIQRDENEALKAALESTLQAKQDDLALYNEMIEQTKLVFLQGLRQVKNKAN